MLTNDFDDNDPTLNDVGHDEASMPLGTEDFNSQSGFVTSEAPSAMQRHAGGALLLAVVVVVALVGLFSMRTLTKASAATDAPTDAEKTIEAFLKMIDGSNADEILASSKDVTVIGVLSESYTQQQVPLTNVQRNPFIIFEPDESKPNPVAKEEVDPIIEQRRVREEDFKRAGDSLRIGSILMGSRPLTNINNHVLRVGDALTVANDVTFFVTEIRTDSVDLVAEDRELGVRVPITVNIRRDR